MLLKLKIFMDSGQLLEEVIGWPDVADTPSPEDIGLMMRECHGIRTVDAGWLFVDDKAIDAIVVQPIGPDLAPAIGTATCDCGEPVSVIRVIKSNLYDGECSYCGSMNRVLKSEVIFDNEG